MTEVVMQKHIYTPFSYRKVYHKNEGREKYKNLSNQGGKYHD